ncbi:MAG: ATP-binding cassette domain-containing protein, partial [Proteobacteria bacterium]|nr:ATP-binding cassette domain-containing protein [Pseudomonadota bacterium]
AIAESTRVLSLVRMSESRNQVPESLSHGMLKRIAIAQAFIGSPEIIMLDEPTAGLDPNTADGIKSVIRDLCKRTTFIISSHNLEVIEDLCQKIVILKKGRLHSHENIADLTARTQALTFRLERDPNSNISEIFTSLPMVSGVTLGKPGQHRIVVHYNGEGQHIEIEILKCLAQANISYREMIRGERLQESVADRLD